MIYVKRRKKRKINSESKTISNEANYKIQKTKTTKALHVILYYIQYIYKSCYPEPIVLDKNKCSQIRMYAKMHIREVFA